MTAQATPVPAIGEQRRAAAEFARALGVRRRQAGAPVRTVFVSNELVDKTPLARLLSGTGERGGGGRGGHVRAKLYVSLLWVCAKAPYTVTRPARAWAALLGLEDPEGRGVRRVQQALHDLQARNFIRLHDRGGLPPVIAVLDEAGNGSRYEPPSETYNRLSSQDAPPHLLRAQTYFRIPTKLWTEGHIARLTGPSLAMLLVLLAEQRGKQDPVWFSPERADSRFSLSAGTRTAGLQHLRELGLIETQTVVVSEDGSYISFARRRRAHQVLLDGSLPPVFPRRPSGRSAASPPWAPAASS